MGTCASSTTVISIKSKRKTDEETTLLEDIEQTNNQGPSTSSHTQLHKNGKDIAKTTIPDTSGPSTSNAPLKITIQNMHDQACQTDEFMGQATVDEKDVGSRMAQVPSTARPENILVEHREDLFPELVDIEKEIRLVLVGEVGSGKSTLGNLIIGSEVFSRRRVGVLMDSSTTEVSKKDTLRYNRRIAVVDTPGITRLARKNAFEKFITEALQCVNPGPHIFLLVISIEKRIEPTTLSFLRKFMPFVVLVFTIHYNTNININNILDDIPELEYYIEENKLKHVIINTTYTDLDNLDRSTTQEVKKLLQICDKHARPELYYHEPTCTVLD